MASAVDFAADPISGPTSGPTPDLVVVYSGGLDSLTLLHEALSQRRLPCAISFDYGQRHRRELHCAQQVCEELGIEYVLVPLQEAALRTMGGSALHEDSGLAVPEGHYSAENMALTVVPNRNMVMLALAFSLAASRSIGEVWYGAHGGDSHVYADCRPAFVRAMAQAAQCCHDSGIELKTPWLHLDKAQIVARGLRLGVDYSKSWSCYVGGELPCGQCGSCSAREEAFAANDMTDPLLTTPRASA